MTDPDPPLYDALRALHGLAPRHRLREDHVSDDRHTGEISMYPAAASAPWAADPAAAPRPDPTVYGLPPDHVYAADDDPDGPPNPPLGQELGADTPSSVVELVACERCRAPIVRVLNG